jgi:dolichyl-phosphate-mannose--protein O-mannosyl transferase
LVGFNTSFSWANIGMDFIDSKYIFMRGTHAFAGSLLAPIIFLSCEQMGLSLPASAIGGALVLFDNGYACISRFVFTDAFLFLFLCLSVYTSFKVRYLPPSLPTQILSSSLRSNFALHFCTFLRCPGV